MSKKSKEVAVFTGDLVKSSQLTQKQMSSAFGVLSTCADIALDWHGASLQLSRHRGDGWQVILNRPEYTLRTALFFRAALKALGAEFDTYIGIASGDAEVDNGNDLNDRNDEVFVQSGRALETLKAMTSFAPKFAHATPGAEAAAIVMADHIAEDWTPAQAKAMSYMLPLGADLSYTELAKTLNKSRQVVTKTLNAAGFQRILLALTLLENQYD